MEGEVGEFKRDKTIGSKENPYHFIVPNIE